MLISSHFAYRADETPDESERIQLDVDKLSRSKKIKKTKYK
jgi:hypothetical protein